MIPYYEAEGIAIYHGICQDITPDLVVDHVITDPPYADTTHNNAKSNKGGGNFAAGDKPVKRINFESFDYDVLRDALSLCEVRRWVVMTCDWQHVLPLKTDPPEGLRFVRHGVWVKPNGTPQFTGDRPGHGWEAIAILHSTSAILRSTSGISKMQWNGGGKTSVWTYCTASGEHPTTKPEPLIDDFVLSFTDPGEIILDPFMGSGTTLACAKRLGRKAIGIDRDERWCEVAARRLSQSALPLFAEQGSLGVE